MYRNPNITHQAIYTCDGGPCILNALIVRAEIDLWDIERAQNTAADVITNMDLVNKL